MSNTTVQRSDMDVFRRTWTTELDKTARLALNNGGVMPPISTGGTNSPSLRPMGKIIASNPITTTSKSLYSNIFDSGARPPSMFSGQPSLAPENIAIPEPRIRRKFVVGLDYGTTFTSISYSIHPIDEEHLRAFPWEVKTIKNWPDAGISGSRSQVPSQSWYPSVLMDRAKFMEENLVEDDLSGVEDGQTDFDDRRSMDLDSDYIDDTVSDNDESTEYLWGYAVPYQEYSALTSRSSVGLVKHAKSRLLDTPYTQQDRLFLGPVLDELIRRKLIRKWGKKNSTSDPRDVQDVLTDFLIRVFRHTKSQLTLLHGFSDQCQVQFVLTVPVIWSPQSSRVLQAAMEAAVREEKFGAFGNGSIDNLFIISEPEAAATFVLAATKNILAGETFVLVDAGGGTVDCICYTVASTYPLRLAREEVPPGGAGDNCGATYLNENFRKLLEDRLRHESYLFHNNETVESIVSRIIPKFEDDFKRRIDMTRPCGHKIYIAGLRGDEQQGLTGSEAKRFEANKLIMNRCDYQIIFQPLLDRVEALLATQLKLAFENGKEIKKVFLVGGFGEAPSLRSHLRNYLDEVSRKLPQEICLITDDQNSVTAVSAGAVLRAHNLENGPERIMQSNYGFLRTEPYEPMVWEGHKVAKPKVDEVDGEEYVQSVVYFLVKGKSVPSVCVVKPIPVYHTFETTRKRFLCEEVLYVSDTATASHFPRTHPKNKDVQVAGKILVDMTFLKDKGLIKPITNPSGKGQKYYKVEYELVPMIEGRNLRYEAKYPAGPNGTVQKRAQISIAAAFRPGTG